MFSISVRPNTGTKVVLPPKSQTFVSRPQAGPENQFALECVGFTDPLRDLTIKWRLNGSELVSDGLNFQIESYNRRLLIRNPDPYRHSGIYICEVGQQYGPERSQADARVEIYSPPKWQREPPSEVDLSKSFGGAVEIPCSHAGAVPNPTVRWFLNGLDITSELQCCPESPPMALDPSSGTLKIFKLTPESAGIYQCEVTNLAGSIISATWLRLEGKKCDFLFSV